MPIAAPQQWAAVRLTTLIERQLVLTIIFAPPLIFAPPCGVWEFPFASKESASGPGEFGNSYATAAPQQLILSLFRASLLSGPGMIS